MEKPTEKEDSLLEATMAEKGLLQALIFKTRLISDRIPIDSLDVDLFFTPIARRLFQAITLSRPIEGNYDVTDVINKLGEICKNDHEVELCNQYILSMQPFSFFAVDNYLTLLQAYKLDRKMKSLAKDMRDYRLTVDGFEDQMLLWKDKFQSIYDSHNITLRSLPAANVIAAWNDAAKRYKDKGGLDYLKTGYESLDKVLKVLGGGQMIVLASRPGIGKTTFALNILKNNFRFINKEDKESKAIGFFSLEMHRQELMTKLISLESGVDLKIVKHLLEGGIITEMQNKAIRKAQDTISNLNLFFCDDTTVTVGNIVSHIKAWIRKYKLKLVIIDYLQLISSPTDKKLDSYQQYLKIGMISRSLKLIAMEMDVCILTLAQLNRKVEERRTLDKAPILSDLRESGSIEQDADVVMFLFEDKLDGPAAEAFGKEKTTMIKIAKNRHGPTDMIEFDFQKHKGLFIPLC